MEKKTKKPNTGSVRLPRHILPEKYSITLKPDIESFTFVGEESIQIVVERPDTQIVLHSLELDIVTAEVTVPGKARTISVKQGRRTVKKTVTSASQIWTSKISYNQKAETATLQFPKALPKGKCVLKMVFRGVLNDKLRGYYRSSFTHNGVQKHLATTQFEATDARRAFPCFDEPNIKAVFDVTLVVPEAHTAISNTLPVSVVEHEAGFKAVKFKTTPKMSTYLLAFISGELESIEKKTKSGVLLRVFTTPGKKKQARFALEFGAHALEFYQSYFGIPYPLPGLDLLAIPDFMFGAMENWGAITFRETQLLVDEEQSAASTKQRAAVVIAHELAHQWFGNLVTMDWWTHLWLNEGFASYIEYLAVDDAFPEWHMWNQFMELDYAAGMEKDELLSTHPIEVDVHHPSEIDEIFDDISYRKGSSIIRMLAAYLGPEDFRKGLSLYLKRHAYKNATTEDLWSALEGVSKKPVRSIMQAWTTQPGFPLVSVSFTKDELHLSQKRFFVNPRNAKADSGKQLWPIPISFQNKAGEQDALLMTLKDQSAPVSRISKLNIGETGFYRVAYTPEALKNFARAIEKGTLSVLDRWGIINNAWALAEAGELSTPLVLELCQSYRKETDFTVFSAMLSGVLRVGSFYRTEKWFKAYRAYVRSLLAPTVKRLGWSKKPGESHGDTLLRASALLAYGIYGDEDTIAEGIHNFTAIAKQGFRAVSPDMRTTVYELTTLTGGIPEFNFLKRLYLEAESQEEQNRIARALCSFPSEKLIDRALEFGFSKHVRPSDSWYFCTYVGRQTQGHERLWAFVQAQWPEILKRYGDGGHLLARVIQSLGGMHSHTMREKIKAFYAKNQKPGAERALVQVLEHIETASLWKDRDRELVKKFSAQAT